MDWRKDRDELAEDELLVAITKAYRGHLIPLAHGIAWDGTVYLPKRIECKADWKAKVTGNCFFEVKNTSKGMKSGLTATQADLWAHYVHGHSCILVFHPPTMVDALRKALRASVKGVRMSPERSGDYNSLGVVVQVAVAKAFGCVDVLYGYCGALQRLGDTLRDVEKTLVLSQPERTS